MRLAYLTANARYAFVMGDQIIPMGDHGMLFESRSAAVEAARLQGLTVNGRGFVSSAA